MRIRKTFSRLWIFLISFECHFWFVSKFKSLKHHCKIIMAGLFRAISLHAGYDMIIAMINRAPFLTLSLTNIAKGFSWKATPPSRMMAASEVEDIFFCKATLTLPSVRPDEKIFVYNMTYRKVASNSMSRLVAHLMIFRRLMKRKFDAYVVWPLAKKVPKLNSRPVYCSRLYGKYVGIGKSMSVFGTI